MSRFSWLARTSVLAAIALVAAACNGDGGDGGGAQEQCDADEFGCVVVAEGDPITLGTLLVISGPNASLGQDSQNGTVMAADFLDGTFDGQSGEVLGHTIEWNHQDDGCSADGGQAGGQALAADDDVVAVVGTSCSSAALG
ncbi:MAG: ABC transporter substrate-binding protein, partial [Actinobacteria bacterium]|nr:ABC transporter substrate-binding protein [Actinomycetota bacterium]